MTDPLLTIPDATRRYRVSAKTIRRRLRAGEFPAAYKRPSDHGPEWVIPLSALEEAGFPVRDGADPVEVPEDPEELARYWEERAVAAEAALPAAGDPDPATRASDDDGEPAPPLVVEGRGAADVAARADDRPRDVRGWGVATFFVLLGLAVALLAVSLVADDGGDDALDQDPILAVVRDAVIERTAPGDGVGFVGGAAGLYLPADRVPVAIVLDSVDESADPPLVLAATAGDEDAVLSALRATARIVLQLTDGDLDVVLFDRSQAPLDSSRPPVGVQSAADDGADEGADDGADDAVGVDAGVEDTSGDDSAPSSTAPAGSESAAPATATEGAGDGQTGDRTGATADPAASQDRETGDGEHIVEAGESFWTIAEATVGPDASIDDVTAYWAQLMAANADRLVEPGNPNLLWVGQALLVPPVG